MTSRKHDLAYLERRAEDELQAAQMASHPAAVHAHYVLASAYLERLFGGDRAIEGGAHQRRA